VGYPVDSEAGPGGVLVQTDIPEYETGSLAKFSFSLFWQALRFSGEKQVPILMDY